MANSKEMDIWEHVSELRTRLFWALISLVVTTLISFMFAQNAIEILARPIGGLKNIVSIEVTENVGVFFRVSLLSGFILALPFILLQILWFVAPGLYPHEKRMLYFFIPIATLLFVSGVAFSYFVMLPAAIPFLVSVLGVQTLPRLSNYINFVTNLMFWIGVSFETPLVVFLLAKLNLVTAHSLLKQWRFAIVIIAIVAAVVTPTPDPVNMSILMVPLFLLYLLSCLFAYVANPKQNRRNQENPDQ
ncbi:Sec-independent protein translocase TatC [Anaerolinea thermolimosa]|uniref:twin-arginine translocase subunit TatC n=1 Tax=Anaerolinea thermolimosa TaxID=229919 RepID=UPI0007860113|nr:twin-arginine translocase subunit TatC [Anaerolinea thermolimosa]GAP06478.1 Sec-independent protein translocase TatC [Anaerolinea thermolimosa]